MVSKHHFFIKEDSSMFFSRHYENISKNIFGNAVNFYFRIVAPIRLYGTKGSQYVVMPIYESLWPHLLTKDSIDSGVELLEKKKLDPKAFENFLKEMERLSEIEKFANNLGDKLAKEIVDAKSRGEVIDFEKVVQASKNKK